VFIWDAEHYNNGQVISSPQTNGYAGLAAFPGVDFSTSRFPNETLFYGRSMVCGRPVAGDSPPRRPYAGTGLNDYNVAGSTVVEWINFTRFSPAHI